MDKNPIGFMSYARSDDDHEDGNLSDFRKRLCGEVRMQSGDDSFELFQDHIHITWGEQWQQRLDATLDSVMLLIPIITPKFFKSDACRAEVARFAQREKQLGRTDLIFPVYYVNANVLEDKAKLAADDMAQVIADHQHVDWRELRHESLTSADARRMLAKMAKEIVAAMARGSAPATHKPAWASAVGADELAKMAKGFVAAMARESVPATHKPAWASAVGVDEFGEWAEISVDNVVQRLRWIEPGNFLMESPKDEAERFDEEGPQHRVTISRGLWLADTACTQALWQAVMGENPSRFHEGNGGGPQHPVEGVSWNMIQPFLQAMTAKLPGCQVTLPTEAEWEYGCRAGSKTAYSFGETISAKQINFDDNNSGTLSVKNLPANKWGLYQMHGNVWEWCADDMRRYKNEAVGDPGLADALKVLAEGGAVRVLRGGGWGSSAQYVRSACRFPYQSGWLNNDVGFRLALRS